jgi:hypothetical protein
LSEKNLQVLLQKATDYLQKSLLPRCDVVLSECPVAINWTDGKAELLEGVTGRQYPDKPGYQCGTSDLVCILKDGTLLIADWKTGGTDGATEQLLSLACGFHRCMLDGSGNPRPVRISCLKVTEDGVDPDERPVSPEQLANHWMAMEIAWTQKDKKNVPVPGIHCTQLYCPHLAYCSAVTGLVEDAAAEDDEQLIGRGQQPLVPAEALVRSKGKHALKMTDNPRSDEEAGYVMSRVTAARRQQKYYESCMKEYVSKGGRVIAGNYEWRETGSGYRWGRIR